MRNEISSENYWILSKSEPSSRFFVSQKEYENFIHSFGSVYEIHSIHRDDTDFKTYTVNNNKSVLIGWADYYQRFFYIYK